MAGHDTQSKAELLTRLTDRMRESLLPVDQPFDDANLDTAAELVLDTASSRTQGEPAVAMADGGEGKRKLRIAIVNDDMPFLVDSVSAQVAEFGLSIDRLVHPVLHVQRDAQGVLEREE